MAKPIVLVIEDNWVQRKVINVLADEYGFTPVLVSSCSEAFEALSLNIDDYAMILMDVRMPDTDGFECTQRILELQKSRNKRIPIVAMTGVVSDDIRKKCLAGGMSDYLQKPFSAKELQAIIIKWTKQKLDGKVLEFPNSERTSEQK
jgi:CheY-like chemotaxis protein